MLPPQMRDPIAAMPGCGNPTARDPLAGRNDLNEDRAAFAATTWTSRATCGSVFDAANKNNTAIYAVDPRGLAGVEFDISENIGGGPIAPI